MSFPISWLSDWGERKGVPRGVLRKLCNTMGNWGPALALILMCFVSTSNTTIPVVLLAVSGGFNVGVLCGFQINHMDLSPNFAGLLISITNTAASIVGLLAPLVVGKMVTDWVSIANHTLMVFSMIKSILYFYDHCLHLMSRISQNIQLVFLQTNVDQWKTIFFMSAAIYFLGNLIFIIFGSGETQCWNNADDSKNIDDDTLFRPRVSSKCLSPVAINS